VGTLVTITANCTNASTSYTWTGTGCVGSVLATCPNITKNNAGQKSFTVQGTNGSGTGTAAPITLFWHL
jgi:hypothetical protein